eukprot:11600646-Alexandrium_andersonii.AAC.1
MIRKDVIAEPMPGPMHASTRINASMESLVRNVGFNPGHIQDFIVTDHDSDCDADGGRLSLIHISEPTRLALI